MIVPLNPITYGDLMIVLLFLGLALYEHLRGER